MGVGRRMKKQGPPATLEELGISLKREKVDTPLQNGQSKKRKKPEEHSEPKKLVKLDRALRQDRGDSDAIKAVKKKQKKTKLVNSDAQIIPQPIPILANDNSEDELEDGVDAMPLDDVEISSGSLSEDDLDELAQADLEQASDSVFDSEDERIQPTRMFSEDEDDSDALEKLTAANIEGLSRKLDQQQAQVDEEAQAELEDAALQTNIAGDEGILDGDEQSGLAPDLQLLRSRITETIRILGDFTKLADKTRSRAEYTQRLISDICLYYGYTPYLAEKLYNLFTPAEAFAFFEANETPRPVVLRTNTLRTNRRTLAQALINRGVVLEPVGKWSKVGLQVFESPVPLGATPEYLAGHYLLQAASSFLPVMALAPQPNERILDMAAAPGGKTTYISALMRNTGAVFANDANRKRAKGLIGNIHRLGCKNTIVCHYDAQKAFPKILGGFDRVLLDAPCSGTGVIGKDPSVKTSKNERDFLALPHMQKQLLLAAIDSVDHASKTGGYVVYSTCSVTVEENEGVVQYILRKRPNVKIVETGLGTFGTEGFRNYMGKKFDDSMNMTRRYFPHKENVDGFFVCKLRKTGPTPKGKATTNGAPNEEVEVAPDKEPVLIDGVNGTDATSLEDVDDFAAFDNEGDTKIMENAEKKWLRARGLDPNSASKPKTANGTSRRKSGGGHGGKVETSEAKSRKEARKEQKEQRESHKMKAKTEKVGK